MKDKLIVRVRDASLGKGWYKINYGDGFAIHMPDAELIDAAKRLYPQATAVQITREYRPE